METINFIFTTSIILYLSYQKVFHRIKVSVNRTFWEKKPFGITVWWYNSSHTYGQGKTFNWKDEDKIKDDINNKKS